MAWYDNKKWDATKHALMGGQLVGNIIPVVRRVTDWWSPIAFYGIRLLDNQKKIPISPTVIKIAQYGIAGAAVLDTVVNGDSERFISLSNGLDALTAAYLVQDAITYESNQK